MKVVKCKLIKIFSDGSLNICQKYYDSNRQVLFYEKDHKNFQLTKKTLSFQIQLESSSKFKKKYLV